MSSTDDPRGSIIAAEIAVVDDELEAAEDALLESLSRVRRQKEEEIDNEH